MIVPEERTVTTYRCSVCGRTYSSEAEAQSSCGLYETEPPKFKIGDFVKSKSPLYHQSHGNYIAVGQIVAVHGPVVGHVTEDNGTHGTYGHVYMYEIDFSCQECGVREQIAPRFYAWELEHVHVLEMESILAK